MSTKLASIRDTVLLTLFRGIPYLLLGDHRPSPFAMLPPHFGGALNLFAYGPCRLLRLRAQLQCTRLFYESPPPRIYFLSWWLSIQATFGLTMVTIDRHRLSGYFSVPGARFDAAFCGLPLCSAIEPLLYSGLFQRCKCATMRSGLRTGQISKC